MRFDPKLKHCDIRMPILADGHMLVDGVLVDRRSFTSRAASERQKWIERTERSDGVFDHQSEAG